MPTESKPICRSYEKSPVKFALYGLIGVLFVIAANPLSDGEPFLTALRNPAHYVDWFGTIFFGSMTLLNLWSYLRLPNVVVVVSPTGLLDKRLSDTEIPWGEISDLKEFRIRYVSMLLIKTNQQFEEKFDRKSRIRIGSKASMRIYGTSIGMQASGLETSFAELSETVIAAWKFYSSNPSPQERQKA